MRDKHCRPWTNTMFCGAWSGFTLLRPFLPNTYVYLHGTFNLSRSGYLVVCYQSEIPEQSILWKKYKIKTSNIWSRNNGNIQRTLWIHNEWNLSTFMKTKIHMVCNARKGLLCNLRTTQAPISLCLCTGWSGPLLSAYRISRYCSICQ